MASPRRRRARKLAAAEAAPTPLPPTPASTSRAAAPAAKQKKKPVVVEMAPEEDIVVTVNYDGMTKSELQELCDAKGISYGRMTAKSTLIRLLKG
jgi:hypothetical protein